MSYRRVVESLSEQAGAEARRAAVDRLRQIRLAMVERKEVLRRRPLEPGPVLSAQEQDADKQRTDELKRQSLEKAMAYAAEHGLPLAPATDEGEGA